MAKRLIVLDYDAVRKAFDEEYKATRKLIESGEDHLDNLAEGFTEADRVLRKMLTVDAVEVCYCKDCNHMDITPDELRWCNVWNAINGMGDYGYCNYSDPKGGQAPQREDV